MSHTQRYRSGPRSEIQGKIAALDKVEVGDLVCLKAGGYFASPVQVPGATFQDTFAGVLVEGGTSGTQTTDLPALVQDTGEFEFPTDVAVAAATSVGTLVGMNAAQVVSITSITAGNAIGRLCKPAAVGDRTVLVRIMSMMMIPSTAPPATLLASMGPDETLPTEPQSEQQKREEAQRRAEAQKHEEAEAQKLEAEVARRREESRKAARQAHTPHKAEPHKAEPPKAEPHKPEPHRAEPHKPGHGK